MTPLIGKIGKHRLANGWTVSVIDDGYGLSHGRLEAWAWDADGNHQEQPRGWLTPDEVEEYIEEVKLRPAKAQVENPAAGNSGTTAPTGAGGQ